ncbi:branched-chain amino acid ABC transporter permease [Pseudonocardia sp.]|uniref:branched-chain amino acid ABC transporter permease n=1 Tax=Pseudonocardia sp. TaxID=60912 RepID=UPI003D1433EE
MLRTYRTALIGCALLVLGGLYGLTSETAAHTMALTAVWALMATGWNIVSGYTGPISLGQGAFFGLTAFTTTILFATYDITPYVGIAVGVVASLLLAALIGLVTLRLSGLYFALATLTIPLIMGTLTRYFGFYEVPRPYKGESLAYFQFNESLPYYVAAAVLVAGSLFFTARLEGTRTGRYFVAIRENERAAEASGVPTLRYKFIAFAIGAVFSALAGGLYSQLSFVFNPEGVYSPIISVQALLIVLIGGSGTVLGPLIGAAIVIPLSEFTATYFSHVPGLNELTYAVVLLVVAFWSRRGLYPFLADGLAALRARWRPRGGPPQTGPPGGAAHPERVLSAGTSGSAS